MNTKITIQPSPGFIKSLEEHLDKTGKNSAEEIRSIAQEIVPVDTGNLRESISVERDGKNYLIGSDLEYSGFVEFGTMRQAPSPFMRPALDRVLSGQQ